MAEAKPEKRCRTCKQIKPRAAFARQDSHTNATRSRCLECEERLGMSPWQNIPAHKRKSYNRVSKVRNGHGMSPEEYDEKLREQDGRCAICGTTIPGKSGNFPIDHDHDTGSNRGLLCHSCNKALGLLGDSLRNLINAQLYLMKWGKKL